VAAPAWVTALKSVDFPAFGSPTMPICSDMGASGRMRET
jgi:hypothetical protein